MGRPDYHKIPSGVLLDNPGITREEFAEILNHVRAWHRHFSEHHRWSGYNGKGWSEVFTGSQKGMEALLA